MFVFLRKKLRLTSLVMMAIMGFITVANPVFADHMNHNEQSGHLNKMNETARSVYELAKAGNPLEAKVQLDILSMQAMEMHYDGITTIEGVDAFMASIVTANKSLNATQYSKEEGTIATARVWFAIDAMVHPKEPLWTQYYKTLSGDLQALKLALLGNQLDNARNAYTEMYRHYSIIKPAMLITSGAVHTEKAQSLFKLTKDALSGNQIDDTKLRTAVIELEVLFEDIFFKSNVETSLLYLEEPRPLFLWMTGIGSVIVSILTFVAWRKFRYDRDKVTVFRTLD